MPDRRSGDRRQPVSRLVKADCIELLEQRPRRLGPGVDVGVVGVLARPEGADQDRLRHSPRKQVSQQRRLALFERDDRCVTGEERIGDFKDVGAVADQRLEGGGNVEHERGVGHVAEVDDPGHPMLLVEQQVVERDVVVDHLRPEARKHGQDRRLKALDDSIEQCAPLAVLDQRGVPEQQR